MTTHDDERVMTPREMAAYIGLSISTINRLHAAGDFPNPIRLTKSRIGWRKSDVEKWLSSRQAKPNETAP